MHIVTLLLGTEEGGLKRDYGRSLKEVEEKENDTSEHFHFNGFAIVYVHLHMMLVVSKNTLAMQLYFPVHNVVFLLIVLLSCG